MCEGKEREVRMCEGRRMCEWERCGRGRRLGVRVYVCNSLGLVKSWGDGEDA